MKIIKKRHGMWGFTLVETMIALFILAFALLAIGQMQIMAIQGNTLGNRMTAAVTLAQDKIEELRGLSYSQIVSGEDSSGVYTRVWDVQDDTPATGLKTVTVTVSWQDTIPHQVSLKLSSPVSFARLA